jgi:transcriptional regulator with XRE-family HTH domain
MNLGEKLRMLRKTINGLTLIDVAKQTGLSVSFLSDLERGQTRPSLETLEKLSSFYKVSINELLVTIEKDRSASQDKVLPNSLQDLLKEIKIEPDILDLMLTVEQRSKNQRASKEDWRKYYYSLKMLLGR